MAHTYPKFMGCASLPTPPYPPCSPEEPAPQRPAVGIESFGLPTGLTRFSDHAQSIRFVFSANQIRQIWREALELRTSDVATGQSSRSPPRRPEGSRDLGTRMPGKYFTQQIISSDKYRSIFSRQIETILHIVTLMNMTPSVVIQSHQVKRSAIQRKY